MVFYDSFIDSFKSEESGVVEGTYMFSNNQRSLQHQKSRKTGIFLKSFFFYFQPVLVTLSWKSDPLWRDYEQQCLADSQSSGSTVSNGPNLISPSSFSSQNPNDMDMIHVKLENASDFATVFPDSSSMLHFQCCQLWLFLKIFFFF